MNKKFAGHRIYVSGPMSNIPNYNHSAFFEMEKRLLENHRCTVLNPAHVTDRHISKYHGKLKDKQELYREYIRHDIALIFSATAIVMLHGWQCSKGAVAELSVAKALDLAVFHQEDV